MPRVSQMAVNVAAGLESPTACARFCARIRRHHGRRDPRQGDRRHRRSRRPRRPPLLCPRFTPSTDGRRCPAPRYGRRAVLLASTLAWCVAQRLVRRSACLPGELRRRCHARRRSAGTPRLRAHARRAPRRGSTGGADDLSGGVRCSADGLSAVRDGSDSAARGHREVFPDRRRHPQDDQERDDGAVIREAAIAAGMKKMFQDGLAKGAPRRHDRKKYPRGALG